MLNFLPQPLQTLLKKIPPQTIIFFIIAICYLFYFWINAFQLRADGIYAGHENVWADGAAHLTMISGFAYRTLSPTDSPFVINTPYSYPFVVNWLSAIFAKAGVDIFSSFSIVSFWINVASICLLYIFCYRVLKTHSKATLASTLYLTNGGLGFTYYLNDIWHSPDKIHSIINPFRYVTHMPEFHFHYINIVHSMFMTQRSFSLGLLVGLGILLLFEDLIKNWHLSGKKIFTLIALISLLPIIHMHTYLSLGIMLLVWSLWYTAKPEFIKNLSTEKAKKFQLQLVTILTMGGFLSLFLISIFFGHNISGHFIHWQVGWYANDEHLNWFYFWWLNWGITLPMWIISCLYLFKKRTKSHLLGYSLAGLMLFTLVNLIVWQPNIFDNTKLLAWASLMSSLTIANFLLDMWQRNWLVKTAVALLFVFITFSGFLDVYRVIKFDLHTNRMYSNEELELANWAKENTPTDSIWLTGDQHNHWLISLTGRKHLLAYRGWLWTHGYDYSQIETDMQQMFTEPQTHQNLFQNYHIQYIVIGPQEIGEWHANQFSLDQLGIIVYETPHYQVLMLNP